MLHFRLEGLHGTIELPDEEEARDQSAYEQEFDKAPLREPGYSNERPEKTADQGFQDKCVDALPAAESVAEDLERAIITDGFTAMGACIGSNVVGMVRTVAYFLCHGLSLACFQKIQEKNWNVKTEYDTDQVYAVSGRLLLDFPVFYPILERKTSHAYAWRKYVICFIQSKTGFAVEVFR
jgi:hypothetical protein